MYQLMLYDEAATASLQWSSEGSNRSTSPRHHSGHLVSFERNQQNQRAKPASESSERNQRAKPTSETSSQQSAARSHTVLQLHPMLLAREAKVPTRTHVQGCACMHILPIGMRRKESLQTAQTGQKQQYKQVRPSSACVRSSERGSQKHFANPST